MAAVWERFSDYLRARRRRRTPERRAVLEAAMRRSGHFSADEICRQLDSGGLHVSLATVYHTLGILVEAGLLQRQRFGSSALYEPLSHASDHHHLVCTDCGKVAEVADLDIQRQLRALTYPRFNPTSYSLNIYGLCSRCQRKKRRRPEK